MSQDVNVAISDKALLLDLVHAEQGRLRARIQHNQIRINMGESPSIITRAEYHEALSERRVLREKEEQLKRIITLVESLPEPTE